LLHLCLSLYVLSSGALARVRARLDERGQASAEYALVLLGAAAVALLIVSWATHSNKIGELFNAVLDRLKGHAER
jgi:Flp pilus assembly pilin Flp